MLVSNLFKYSYRILCLLVIQDFLGYQIGYFFDKTNSTLT